MIIMIRKLFFILFILSINKAVYAGPAKYFEAMSHYRSADYAIAYEIFSKVALSGDIDEQLRASAEFYKGECLLGLRDADGAIIAFENFIDKYSSSAFTDLVYYKLGTLYYKNTQYFWARHYLTMLIRNYPESYYAGTAYYWIGQAFLNENKTAEAEKFFREAISSRINNRFIDYSIYSLANLYEKTGELENAISYYDELLTYYQTSSLAPFAQLRIGICYFILKDYDSAVLELSDPLIGKLPFEAIGEAKSMLATSFFRLKEYENASNTFREMLDRYSSIEMNPAVLFGLAWVNFQLENYGESQKIFEQLSESPIDSISSKSKFWLGENYRYSGNSVKALEKYENFINKYPSHYLTPIARFNIGVIYFNDSQTEKAAAYLRSVVKSNDDNTNGRALTLLGEISLFNSDFPTAEGYFRECLRIRNLRDDSANRSTLGLAVAQYYKGEYNDAIVNLNYLSDKFKRFEKDRVAYYLGESFFALRDYGNALRAFSRVGIEDNSIYLKALYGRAYSLFNLKDFANASYYFSEFLKIESDRKYKIDATLRLADSYYGTKNFDKSTSVYTDAFRNYKMNELGDFAAFQYGQSLFNSGKGSEALSVFQKLQRDFPRSAYSDDSQYFLGWINFKLRNYETAISEYRRLVRLYPSSNLRPIVYYSIGDAYYNKAEYDSAIASYQKLLDEFPRSEYVIDAVNGIQYSCIAKENPDQAVSIIDRFVSSYPMGELSDRILFKKGEIYYAAGEYSKAQTGYKELIATYPSSLLIPDAYYWIGKSALSEGYEDKAIYNFEIVVNSYLYTNIAISAAIDLGTIYAGRKEYQKIIELSDRTIENLRESDRIPEVYFLKGKAELKLNDKSQAYKTFAFLSTKYESSIFASKSKIEVGKFEIETGNPARAEEIFGEITLLRSDDIGAEAQYYLGVSLLEQKKIDEAISAFVRVRTVYARYDEWYSRSLLKLGDCYIERKEKLKAKEMFRAVAEKHKDDEIGKEARKKLRNL